MFGSGEKTVAPTICFPSVSFCLAVLYSRAGACCPGNCAFPAVIQHKTIQPAVNKTTCFALICFSLHRSIIQEQQKSLCSASNQACTACQVARHFYMNGAPPVPNRTSLYGLVSWLVSDDCL